MTSFHPCVLPEHCSLLLSGHRQSRQPTNEGSGEGCTHAHPWVRRMGARILPQVPKQEARLPEQLVACRELEASQPQLGAG